MIIFSKEPCIMAMNLKIVKSKYLKGKSTQMVFLYIHKKKLISYLHNTVFKDSIL